MEIKKGQKGEIVRWLQQKLIDYGFETCWVDDKVKKLTVDGDFGPITEECLSSFQAKIIDSLTDEFIKQNIPIQYQDDLFVTGIVDFRTWYILENYDKLKQWYKIEIKPEIISEPIDIKNEIIKNILEIAENEIGTVEEGSNNYGDRVEEYQNIGSDGAINGGAAWCQYFMNWLQIKTCEKLKLDYKGTYSGYTPTVTNWGIKNKIAIKYPKITDIEIGDMGYVYSSTRKNSKHVYLIVGKSGNNVITIEGNTNNGGGSDGFGVFKRKRSLGNQCWAIVKWWKLY